MIVGHPKGSDARENVRRNFRMARPEGCRKALRLVRLAGKFGFPLICFIDTPDADPSMESEKCGQGNVIAENILTLAGLRILIVACVIGEGESGGAHTAAAAIAAAAGEAMHDALDELTTLPVDELLQRRYAGYRAIGRFQERQPPMIERNLPALPFKGL